MLKTAHFVVGNFTSHLRWFHHIILSIITGSTLLRVAWNAYPCSQKLNSQVIPSPDTGLLGDKDSETCINIITSSKHLLLEISVVGVLTQLVNQSFTFSSAVECNAITVFVEDHDLTTRDGCHIFNECSLIENVDLSPARCSFRCHCMYSCHVFTLLNKPWKKTFDTATYQLCEVELMLE